MKPHIILFEAPAGVEKTHLTLDLLKRGYLNHFDFVIIIVFFIKWWYLTYLKCHTVPSNVDPLG